ncbi:Arm DNA-binding domain-containing protein [Photorhabdus laumondii]|uniref:Arm DNA-binding domain-containing protein n=1 Tax=Photorhabdus laumondii TaxID=2218628 RepID=UPI0026CC559B
MREKEYKLTDVQGLYLLIKPSGSKRWYLKYRFTSKESRIALGAYPQVTLGKAREQRDSIKIMIRNGINPSKKEK